MKSLDQCKVLVTPTSYASQDPTLKTDLEELVGEVNYNTTGKPLTSPQLQEMLPEIDGMIAGLDEIDSLAISCAKNLKVIARYGVGYNNVDLEAAKSHGITVTNTPGANSKSVAELTIALILNLLRPLILCDQQTKEGKWPRYKGFSLEGKTIGLIGLGAIGKEVARRLKGFDCIILAYDVYQDDQFAVQNEISYKPLDDLLDKSDVISLHLPGTDDTKEMVNDQFIDKMKTGAWLVNTARGDLVDEDALIRGLKSGKLRGAALDVFQKEPPEAGNPLFLMDNVILTPHMGAHADSATNNMGRMALDDCLRVLRGEQPIYKIV